jgi:hypothetical protein
MSDCPWPVGDRITLSQNQNGHAVIQIFRSADDDGEGFDYPVAEFRFNKDENLAQFVATLLDFAKADHA